MQPIKADPDLVKAQGAAISGAAKEIRESAQKLYSLGYGPVKSKAVDALKGNVRELAVVMDDAWDRYDKTGSALSTYAPVLRDAVRDVNDAISAMAHTDVHGATVQAYEAESKAKLANVNPLATQEERDAATLAADHAQQNLHHQQLAASSAQSKYDAAMSDLHAAAKHAASQIELGISMSQLNDRLGDRVSSVLDKLHNLLSKVLAAMHEILKFLAQRLPR